LLSDSVPHALGELCDAAGGLIPVLQTASGLAKLGTSIPFAECVTDTIDLCVVLATTVSAHLILLTPDAVWVSEARRLVEQPVLADELALVLVPFAVIVHHAVLLVVDESALLVAHHLRSIPHAFRVLGAVQLIVVLDGAELLANAAANFAQSRVELACGVREHLA
jgi:hypothetical protein